MLFSFLHSRYPLTIKSGQGCFLTTTDGKEYLDCVSGIATCILGHNNPALTKAISDQMQKVHHVSNLYFIPEQAALANWLCANSQAEKAFFCNSGAEANEAAIKLARKHASNRGITVSCWRKSYCLQQETSMRKLVTAAAAAATSAMTFVQNETSDYMPSDSDVCILFLLF
jgi:acetylornithine/succinyldiaminopimelate/putrescine aminotransferase